MTQTQASELEHVVNIEAAAQYVDSDMAAYLDGYADGMNHVFDIMRGGEDDAYFAGYQAAVRDEQAMVELGWIMDAVDVIDMEPARMPWERPA